MQFANESRTAFRLTLLGFVLLIDVSGYPAHNYAVLTSECIERVRSDFGKMKKADKIRANGRLIGFYSFNESSSNLIALSVSKTNVKLPILNLNFTNLMLLDASFNGLESIDNIGNGTFPSLQLFNASHNAITNVKSHVFGHLKEVEILDLSHNCFVRFHPDYVFLQHENLKKIYLNNNLLHTIQFKFSEPRTMKLDHFDLSNNFIDEFANFEIQIDHLKLQNNKLTSVVIFNAENMIVEAQHNEMVHFIAPRSVFKKLNLSYNHLSYLSNVELNEATILDLSHNNITSWSTEPATSDYTDGYVDSDHEFSDDSESSEKETIKKLHSIKTQNLNLSYNNISSVHELKHFADCITLNLQGNAIKNIDAEDFRVLFPMLKRVNLMENPLTKVDQNDLKFFNSTRLLQLHFDFETTTKAPPTSTFLPLLPPLFPLPAITTSKIIDQTDSTTLTPMTSSPQTESTAQSKSIIATTETHQADSTAAKAVETSPFSIWIFAFVFAFVIVSSVIFMIYRKQYRGVRIINRGYNETENFM